MDKVKCRICGKEFKRITRSHLRDKHNITSKEYYRITDNLIKKYYLELEMTYKQCASQFGCSDKLIRDILDELNIKKRGKSGALKILYRDKTNHPCYGREYSNELKQKISNSQPNKGTSICYNTGRTRFKKGDIPWTKINGNPKMKREGHWNWQDGKSFEEYPIEWEEKRRLAIRYWGNICHVCGSKENICVHHINYDKEDCRIMNLIPLCRSCHTKTNMNRILWHKIFICNVPFPAEFDKEYKVFMDNHWNSITEEEEEKLLCL